MKKINEFAAMAANEVVTDDVSYVDPWFGHMMTILEMIPLSLRNPLTDKEGFWVNTRTMEECVIML